MPTSTTAYASPDRLQQAIALHRQGQLASAQAIYTEILTRQPRHFDALHLLGVMAAQQGDAGRALELIAAAITVDPNNAAAHVNQGLALKDLGRLDEALASLQQAITLQPDLPEACYHCGLLLMELARFDAALTLFTQAIALREDFAEAHCCRGLALRELKQPREALASFDRALALRPDFPEALSNRGLLLKDLKEPRLALDSYDRAIALKPDFAEAFYNRGLLLKELRQFDAALASYNRAIALKADCAEAYCDRGNLLKELQHPEAALASYERAITIKGDFADAHANRGNLLRELMQYEAAVQSYDAALAYRTRSKWVRGMRLHAKMHIALWDDLQAEFALLTASLEREEAALPPFCAMALSDSAALQRRAAQNWVRQECPPDESLGRIAAYPRHEKIRVGYFSADFRSHPVAMLMAPVFEAHDRSRFELSAFSFRPGAGDPMSARLARAFDRFVEVPRSSDQEVAQLARRLEIDIAVDLGGFTAGSRSGMFALRAAPIQVNYLGYSGTLGAPYMDYIIADSTVIPLAARPGYSEKVAWLPHCYLPAGDRAAISVCAQTRADCGLPPQGIVYCCFNAHHKITPGTFDSWMRLLHAVDDSVLWLKMGSAVAVRNLRKEAARRGIAPERIVFAAPMPRLEDHLARHCLADLFLDTLPYNAHATATDALRAGLPVLTRAGEAFAARVGASLLRSMGLPELIATSAQHYEELAVELAQDRQRLADIREKLIATRGTAPLFDTAAFTGHLEGAYARMYQRHVDGLPADHIAAETI